MRSVCLALGAVMALANSVTAQSTMTRLAPEPTSGYQFGLDLELTGHTLFVRSNGGIHLFSNETGEWLPTDTLLVDRKHDHMQVMDGELVVVSSPNVVTFREDEVGWSATSTTTLPDVGPTAAGIGTYHFVNDSLLVVNVLGTAGDWADVYKRTGSTWSLFQTINPTPSDDFRFKCMLEDRLVLGAPREQTNGSNSGSAYVYKLDISGHYSLEQKIVPNDVEESDQFGRAIACGEKGLVIHAYSGGKTYLYTRQDSLWHEVARIQVPGDNRFLTVRWLEDLLMVRTEDLMEPLPGQTFDAYESTVYLFELEGIEVNIRHVIKSPNPVDRTYESSDGGFGYYTAQDGDWLAISAYFRDTRDVLSVGEVYLTRFSDLPLASGTVEANDQPSSLSLFPNPASSFVNVDLTLETPRAVSIVVVDLLGRTVFSDGGNMSSGRRFQHRVDVRGLSSGAYMVTVCPGTDSCISKALFVAK